jgi:hypothetical protein
VQCLVEAVLAREIFEFGYQRGVLAQLQPSIDQRAERVGPKPLDPVCLAGEPDDAAEIGQRVRSPQCEGRP